VRKDEGIEYKIHTYYFTSLEFSMTTTAAK
jgi:hypothetical protein